jgi:hypothetical protein
MGFGGGRPLPQPGSWLAGLMIGVTVSNLAAGAMMLGTGAAISKAILGKSPPNRGVRPA